MSKKIIDFIKKPLLLIASLGHRGFFNWVNDESYLKMIYRIRTGRKLDLEDPKRFNEKMQWLKIYDRNPLYTRMVDKYEAKKIASDIIGDEYIIPTIGVWDKFEDIDFASLPDKFVLKCTHNSGGIVICRDKAEFNKEKCRKLVKKWMKHNYYWTLREWPYKDIKPRIIIEKYMEDSRSINLCVYKVFNFNGVPKIIQTIQNDKTSYETIDYFDTNWNRLNLRQNFPNTMNKEILKPQSLKTILDLSAKCSVGFPFLRTDWYEVNEKVYFSEFTFFSDAGVASFYPDEWDYTLGGWIELPKHTQPRRIEVQYARR